MHLTTPSCRIPVLLFVGCLLIAVCNRSAAAAAAAAAPLAGPRVSAEQVDAAVGRAVLFLYSRQKPAGDWELAPRRNPAAGARDLNGYRWGTLTGIAVCSLLAAGESPQDPRIGRAVDWLLAAPLDGTCPIAWRARALAAMIDRHPDRRRRRAWLPAGRRDFDLLFKLIRTEPGLPGHGFYAAWWDPGAAVQMPHNHFDRDNSQHGVLAMQALERVGFEVPRRYWETVGEAWNSAQNPDGGWTWKGPGPSTHSMTAAGSATLLATGDYLTGHRGPCTGNVNDKHVDAALARMDGPAAAAVTAGNPEFLYRVSLVGAASGRKYFGGVDWYRQGAATFIGNQRRDGSWHAAVPAVGADPAGRTLYCTASALMFLSRGRAALVMHKLEYVSIARAGEPTPWNQRPHDLAHFSQWMTKAVGGLAGTGGEYDWQTVTLDLPLGALLEAPVLYLAGSEEVTLADADVDKLREYVEAGGLILVSADCAKKRFVDSVTGLATRLFPRHAMRALPPNHPIFVRQQFNAAKWRKPVKVLCVSNGVRELMLLVPEADLSRAWHARTDKQRAELFELGANVYQYATKDAPRQSRLEPRVAGAGAGKPAAAQPAR